MHKYKKIISICSLIIASTACSNMQEGSSKMSWQYLLDDDLSVWETWNGVPHSSVKDLPAGTYQADNLNVGGDPSVAMGLNNDVKNVFTMIEQDGEPVLHISGEIYGGLTTKAEFENYHLSLQVKWGDKKWAPRLNAKRYITVKANMAHFGKYGRLAKSFKFRSLTLVTIFRLRALQALLNQSH